MTVGRGDFAGFAARAVAPNRCRRSLCWQTSARNVVETDLDLRTGTEHGNYNRQSEIGWNTSHERRVENLNSTWGH